MRANQHEEQASGDGSLIELLSRKVVGQSTAMETSSPTCACIRRGWPRGSPAGIFLLLGPTGTGKTRTVEALAEILHAARSRS